MASFAGAMLTVHPRGARDGAAIAASKIMRWSRAPIADALAAPEIIALGARGDRGVDEILNFPSRCTRAPRSTKTGGQALTSAPLPPILAALQWQVI